MRNNKSGFSIMAAMGIGVLMSLGAIAIFQYGQLVESETHKSSIRHSVDIAEDTIRTAIAIASKELTSNTGTTGFHTYIENLKNFQVPAYGTTCGANPCLIKVRSPNTTNLYTDAELLLRPRKAVHCNGSGACRALFMFYLDDPSGKSTIKIDQKCEIISGTLKCPIEIPLPTESTMNKNTTVSAGNLMCGAGKGGPVFKGTRIDSNGKMQAICGAIPANPASYTISPGTQNTSPVAVECNRAAGLWLAGVNPDLSPKCVSFPQGLVSQGATNNLSAPTTLCEGENVAKTFGMDSKFQITNLSCIPKGGPYDFMEKQVGRWAN